MLVDPNTGLPIEEANPAGSTFANDQALNQLEKAGINYDDMPFIYDILSAAPGVGVTTAWNMRRVSNTIIGGGTATRGRPIGRSTLSPTAGRGGVISQGVPQTFGPRHFSRMTRAANIDPRSNDMYSPFGAVSKSGNWAFKKIAATQAGERALRSVIPGSSEMDFRADAFSRGTFGRMAAIARMGTMSSSKLASAMPNIYNAAEDISPGSGFPLLNPKLAGRAGSAAARAAAQASVLNSINGTVSGRVSGFFAGAQNARLGTTSQLLERLNNPAAREGVEAAVRGFGSRGLAGTATRFAGSRGASLGLRAAGPIGTVLLVRDLAMIGGKLLGTVGRTFMEAGTTLAAPLNKGVMGAGYKDNAVAATSRQRGVMAIQNSRLNMRSVLGSEAAMMYASMG